MYKPAIAEAEFFFCIAARDAESYIIRDARPRQLSDSSMREFACYLAEQLVLVVIRRPAHVAVVPGELVSSISYRQKFFPARRPRPHRCRGVILF